MVTIPKLPRRTINEGLSTDQWRPFVDDALDTNDRDHGEIRNDYRMLIEQLRQNQSRNNQLLVALLITIAGSSIMMALTMYLTSSQGG